LKTIGEIQPIDKDFLLAQVKTLKEHLNESDKKVMNKQFEIDRLSSRIDVLNLIVSDYEELLNEYKKRLDIYD
jgi:chromosome segregation ATPase